MEKCKSGGRSKDLLRKFKQITNRFSHRVSGLKFSQRKIINEKKDIKGRWREYSKDLYKRIVEIADTILQEVLSTEPDILVTRHQAG